MYSTRHMVDDDYVQEFLTTQEPDNFDRWAAELADVSTVNDKAANIFWKGEPDNNGEFLAQQAVKYAEATNAPKELWLGEPSWMKKRKAENFRDCWNVSADSEALVFVNDDRFGNRIVRFWLNRDTNITARIRYCQNEPHYLVEFFMNHRNSNGSRYPWSGTLIAKFSVHRTVTDEAELTVSKYVALEFAKAQASA